MLFALILLFLAISFSGAAAVIWSNAAQTSDLHGNRERAYYIAQAGMQKAFAIFQNDPNVWNNWINLNESFGGGYYQVVAWEGQHGHGHGWFHNSGKKTVVSTGYYGDAQRTLSQVVGRSWANHGWWRWWHSRDQNSLTEE